MKYWFIEAYNDYGDYSYYVFVETKEEIVEALKNKRDETELTIKIHSINGPFDLYKGRVLTASEPS